MTALRLVRIGVWAAVVVLGVVIAGLVLWERGPETSLPQAPSAARSPSPTRTAAR